MVMGMSIFHSLISGAWFHKCWNECKLQWSLRKVVRIPEYDVVSFDDEKVNVELWAKESKKMLLWETYMMLWVDLSYVSIAGSYVKLTKESLIFFPSLRSIHAGAIGGKEFLLEALKREIIITVFDETKKFKDLNDQRGPLTYSDGRRVTPADAVKRQMLLDSIHDL